MFHTRHISYSAFLFILLLLLGSTPTLKAQNISKSTRDEIKERRAEWLSWATRWDKTIAVDGFNERPDGDATLFNGLLCLAGDSRSCKAVRKAQGKDGQWWRSPRRVGKQTTNSFSRDMSLGVLCYLVKTKDKRAAKKWLTWIRRNAATVIPKQLVSVHPWLRKLKAKIGIVPVLCTDDTDGRCFITPRLWGIFYEVWNYMGLEPSVSMKVFLYYDHDLVKKAENIRLGYPLHLAAVELLLKQYMKIDTDITDEAAQVLVKRQPENPFFRYLRDGRTADVAAMMLEKCPQQRPVEPADWAWQRSTNSETWKRSMGWDCIFLADMLLADEN